MTLSGQVPRGMDAVYSKWKVFNLKGKTGLFLGLILMLTMISGNLVYP